MWKFLSPRGCFTTRDFSSRSKSVEDDKKETVTYDDKEVHFLTVVLTGVCGDSLRCPWAVNVGPASFSKEAPCLYWAQRVSWCSVYFWVSKVTKPVLVVICVCIPTARSVAGRNHTGICLTSALFASGLPTKSNSTWLKGDPSSAHHIRLSMI